MLKKILSLFGETGGATDKEIRTAREEAFGQSSFASLLPYESFDERSGLFFNRGSVGFVVEAVPIVGSDEKIEAQLATIFDEVMEEGSSIQCFLWADHRSSGYLDSWSSGRRGEIFQTLAEKRKEYLLNSEKFHPRIFRFILSYSQEISEEPTPVHQQKLMDKRERMTSVLKTFTSTRVWTAEDLITSLDGLINFSLDPQQNRRKWNTLEGISEQISTGGAVHVDEDSLSWDTLGESELKTFRVVDYPESWSLGAMQQLIGDLYRDSFRVSSPFFIHYGVHMPSQKSAENALWSRTQLIENQAKSGFLLRTCPGLSEEYEECGFVRKSLHNGSRVVWTQLGVGVWAKKGEMPRAEESIKSLFRMNHFVLADNQCVHLAHFLSSLPMSWAEQVGDLRDLGVLKTTISSECANLMPLQGEWMGTPTAGMLFLGRRGQLCNWNPFDNDTGNFNCVVVGRSGTGKSVFMQDLLLNGLATGARVFVLEVGRSFEKMCHLVGGQSIEFSKGSGLCLNPFTLISESCPDERNQSFSMLRSIVCEMCAPTSGTNDLQNALVEQGIQAAWAKRGRQATITDIGEWLFAQSDERATSLGTMLSPFMSGGNYATYFEGENNINFSSAMVLVELEELKNQKDLQSVALQIFMMNISSQVFLGDRTTPFYICVDEAWDLLRGKQTGIFIETLARRLRKYRGSLVIGTQNIDDFFASEGARAAYENSDWMCVLGQKKSSIQRLNESNKMTLDEHQMALIGSVTTRQGEYSEVAILDPEGGCSVLRLVLDPFSELLYSTKAEEFARINELKSSGASTFEAIEEVVAERRRG